MIKYVGSDGPLANFLLDFGPALLVKYTVPAKGNLGIQCSLGRVTDYGDSNHLCMDYEGFDPECYYRVANGLSVGSRASHFFFFP